MTREFETPISSERNRSWYPLRPIVVDAATAHKAKMVVYAEDGKATFQHPQLELLTGQEQVDVPMTHQHPGTRAMLEDLGKAISRTANSPLLEGGRTLRDLYDEEVRTFEALDGEREEAGDFEPNYGSYVYDHFEGRLYTILPKFWHRLGLVVSTGNVYSDPKENMSWKEKRDLLASKVVGIAGASVGSSIAHGWVKAGRPEVLKLADPDMPEIQNLNRIPLTLRHLIRSRAERFDPKASDDIQRYGKADATARELHMVDPYMTIYVYSDGIHEGNINHFLLGDSQIGEPPVDLLAEETDEMKIKITLRQFSRDHHIPFLMMSDIGQHAALTFFKNAKGHPEPLWNGLSDQEILAMYQSLSNGDRQTVIKMFGTLIGPEYDKDPHFNAWLRGSGEQPTASTPQAGETAMAAGAIAGGVISNFFLGHEIRSYGVLSHASFVRENN